MAGALAEQALVETGRKAGFVQIEVVGDRVPLRKDRLRRYPLFSVEFLDWLFTQIPEDQTPIYTAHVRMVKPGGWFAPP